MGMDMLARNRRARSERTARIEESAARARAMLQQAARWARQGLVLDADAKRRLVDDVLLGGQPLTAAPA